MSDPIRGGGSSDWDLLQRTRLGALADAPEAFTATYAEERRYPMQRWQARVARDASFVAGQEMGIALAADSQGTLIEQDPLTRQLVSMWVAPGHRSGGVGERLVEAVSKWAKADGASVLVLGVFEGNDRARRLYERVGFRPTGRKTTNVTDAATGIHEMQLLL